MSIETPINDGRLSGDKVSSPGFSQKHPPLPQLKDPVPRHFQEVLGTFVYNPQKELALATQIIDNLREDFSEEMLVNQYQDRLMEVIRRKVEGQQVVLAEKKQPAKVVDLMEALKLSLKKTAQKKPAARAGAHGKSQAEKTEKQKRRRA